MGAWGVIVSGDWTVVLYLHCGLRLSCVCECVSDCAC